jgi:hypothetical protein
MIGFGLGLLSGVVASIAVVRWLNPVWSREAVLMAEIDRLEEEEAEQREAKPVPDWPDS